MTFAASIITLYPEMFPGPLGVSLAGKALERSDRLDEAAEVLIQLEAQVSRGALERPLYIFSDGGKQPEIMAVVMSDLSLGASVEITAPTGENGAVFSGFNDRYNALYGLDAEVFTAHGYDAAYLIGLALCKKTC